MRRPSFSAFVTGALAAVLFSYVVGLGQGHNALRSVLTDDEFAACGLDKLSEQEVEHLSAVLTSLPGYDFLVESAFAYLQQERWRRIRILGYQTEDAEDPWPDQYLVVARAGKVYRFDPPSGGPELEPGTYWARGDGRVWELMLPDGSRATIWKAGD